MILHSVGPGFANVLLYQSLISLGFLPSSFSMYAISLASGLFLLDKPASAISVAVIGVILGWPFSILAFLPVTLYSLSRKFKVSFIAATITSVVFLVSWNPPPTYKLCLYHIIYDIKFHMSCPSHSIF